MESTGSPIWATSSAEGFLWTSCSRYLCSFKSACPSLINQLSSASLGKGDKQDAQVSAEEMRDIWSTIPEPAEAGPSKPPTYAPPEGEEPLPFLDLTLPGFREDNGRLFIPPTVRYAEKTLRSGKDMISEGMTDRGWEPFLDSATKFAFGGETPSYRKGFVSSDHANVSPP